MKNLLILLIFVIVCELAGILATPFTINAIPSWYSTLNKPPFSPPNFVFGPVWTILYMLMGLSAFLVWQKGVKKEKVKNALRLFALQLFLNFIWSILFFGLRSPLLGLIDILILWGLILITIIKFHRVSRTAAYLLIPYILWVSFATILNLSILLLNP